MQIQGPFWKWDPERDGVGGSGQRRPGAGAPGSPSPASTRWRRAARAGVGISVFPRLSSGPPGLRGAFLERPAPASSRPAVT